MNKATETKYKKDITIQTTPLKPQACGTTWRFNRVTIPSAYGIGWDNPQFLDRQALFGYYAHSLFCRELAQANSSSQASPFSKDSKTILLSATRLSRRNLQHLDAWFPGAQGLRDFAHDVGAGAADGVVYIEVQLTAKARPERV